MAKYYLMYNELMIKAVLLDFDGTLVVQDMLDVACEINGKRLESEKINSNFTRATP